MPPPLSHIESPCSGSPAWEPVDLTVSDSGSSSDAETSECAVCDGLPPHPLLPLVTRDAEVEAAWDLLHRPAGFSFRRLLRLFTSRHGPPSGHFAVKVFTHPWFHCFLPRARSAAPLGGSSYASVSSISRASLSSVIPPNHARWHVRRSPPPSFSASTGAPAPRLHMAACSFAQWPGRAGDAAAMAPRVFAGVAGNPPEVPAADVPSIFSHRRLDRRSDAESLLCPPVRTNSVPASEEEPPPADQPHLVAHSLSDILPRRVVKRLRSWSVRASRACRLAEKGDVAGARKAKPPDLLISANEAKRPFKGVVMDLSVYPFVSLQPTRWPDRPPSTDLSIKAIRREFRAHPDFPHRWVRGAISHGNPCFGVWQPVTYLAAPHASALAHGAEWMRQVQKELGNDWAETHFTQSYGLATWPSLVSPSSMVQRHGKWRLCHDLSWPHPEASVGAVSSNDVDADLVPRVRMARLSDLATAAATMLVAGVRIRGMKLDLSACYKRSGQQRSTRCRRSFWTVNGAQTLDRVCFGQTDGPFSCSSQTSFYVFIIRREWSYADSCYPTQDSALQAFLSLRAGVADDAGEPHADYTVLGFVMCFLDDFGALAFCDALYRADGSPVELADGTPRTRDALYFDIMCSVLLRVGHVLQEGDPSKFLRPCSNFTLIGGQVDLEEETLSLDPLKRVSYADRLEQALSRASISRTPAQSLTFRMLVVCETHPLSRQWLAAPFAWLRSHQRELVWAEQPHARAAFHSFLTLLRGPASLSVPLACRHHFPFAGAAGVITRFDDASRPGSDESGEPGFGSWAVHGSTLFYMHGVFSPAEAAACHINVLELFASYMAAPTFAAAMPAATRSLEFTDNSGAEWSARRERSRSAMMEAIIGRRAAWLADSRHFIRTARISSAENLWADMLSRQRAHEVLAAATACGLTPHRLRYEVSERKEKNHETFQKVKYSYNI